MKGIVIYNSIIPKLFSWVIDVNAITLFPFIFIKNDGDPVTENHENIHVAQYAELFIFGFLFLYLFDFIKGVLMLKNMKKAYKMIRFEQEAYAMEKTADYLEIRERFAWRNY